MSERIPLSSIAFDAGTQIRAAIDPVVVSEYADAMTDGAVFPPLVLFHDGNQHYLADGFHRFMAAQRLHFKDFDADVRAGTKQDALWFALGANKTNGKRLTVGDVKHAITMALAIWPERSMREISEQLGCSRKYVHDIKEATTSHLPPSRVTGRDGKSYPASYKEKAPHPKRALVEEMVKAGKRGREIERELGVHPTLVASVRRDLGTSQVEKSRDAVEDRKERMRSMASEGHTSRQIAAELGLSEEGCRATMRREGIEIPADKVSRNARRLNANRIVENIVMDAENLTEGLNLVDFAELDHDRLGEWADALVKAKRTLESFIKRLVKEQQQHGKVEGVA